MLFFLSKTLLFLLRPLIWAIIFFIIAFFGKKEKTKIWSFRIGLATLLFFSNSFIAGKIFNSYESGYPPTSKYDIGILLGGYSNINKRNGNIQFSWTGDRFNQTLLLYRKGFIKKILVVGGSANLINNKVKESDLTRAYLKQIGVPDSAILVENQSRNTIENASLSFKLISEKQPGAKVLIITSAWHIPRTRLTFDKYFKNPQYYPTNFIGKTDYDLADYLMPSAEALSNWDLLIKEWIGLAVDKIRG